MREQYLVPKSQVQQVRDAVDIVDLISEYLPLKKAGVNYKGLCPFHKEKTPSFVVSSVKQIYHCFGCGEGGNAFDFVMKIQSVGFKEALSRLASRAGVELKEYRGSKEQDELGKLFNLNQVAMEFYHNNLTHPKVGIDPLKYLDSRGVSKKEISQFKLGFAPANWDSLVGHLKQKSQNMGDASKIGLVIEKRGKGDYYDRFRNRVVFPIFNRDKQIIGFGGRTLGGDDAKYINSPESIIFSKRYSFYGIDSALNAIREEGSAIVVEGYMDLIALRSFGFNNSVATLGTAFTAEHARVLKKYCDNVFITFDADEAGVMAVKRVLKPALISSLSAKVILLPKSYDPDNFLREHGQEAFKKLMDKAVTILEFYIKNYFEKELSIVGKAKVLNELRETFNEIPSQFERELIVKKVSELTGIKESLFKEDDKKRYIPAKPLLSRPSYPKEELLLLKLVLEDKELLASALKEKALGYFSTTELKEYAEKSIAMASQDGGFEVADMLDNMENQELKSALAQVFINDLGFSKEESEKAFSNCMERLKLNFLKKRSFALQDEILAAEKSGDMERCRELLEEKKSLMRGKHGRQ